MRTRAWYRLFALLWVRRQVVHPCVRRIARHLTHHADARGAISDVREVARLYGAVHRVSTRTFWSDLDRLAALGLVRPLQKAAPGKPAVYGLTVPTELIPRRPPGQLAAALHSQLGHVAAQHAALSECQVVSAGSAARGPRTHQFGCGGLHTSPLFTRGRVLPTTRTTTGPRLYVVKEPTNDELDDAADLIADIEPMWRQKRGPSGALSNEEYSALERQVAILLRTCAPTQVSELLGRDLHTARSLAGVLLHRTGKAIGVEVRAARRADQLIDEARSAQRAERRAAAIAAASDPTVRAAATAQARAAIAAATPRPRRTAWGVPRPERLPRPRLTTPGPPAPRRTAPPRPSPSTADGAAAARQALDRARSAATSPVRRERPRAGQRAAFTLRSAADLLRRRGI